MRAARASLAVVLALAGCARGSTTAASPGRAPSVTLAASDAPAPPPVRWLGLLGEYGEGAAWRIVAEHEGKLRLVDTALRVTPITERAESEFVTDSGGIPVRFTRDATGRASAMQLGDARLARNDIEPRAGYQPAPRHTRQVRRFGPDRGAGGVATRGSGAVRTQRSRRARAPRSEHQARDPLRDDEQLPRHALLRRGARVPPAPRRRSGRARAPRAPAAGLRPADPRCVSSLVRDEDVLGRHAARQALARRRSLRRARDTTAAAAVDLTLYDLATGRAVEMPSTYDESTGRAYAEYPGGTSRQRWHRALLRRAMEAEGFGVKRHRVVALRLLDVALVRDQQRAVRPDRSLGRRRRETLRPLEQQGALALVARERRRALELRRAPRSRGPAWSAGRRARWAAGGSPASDGSSRSASTSSSPSAGPNAIETATARLSSTTGDGVSSASSRTARRCAASPSPPAVRARAWHAAIAACSAYGPRAPPSDSARSSAARPRRISSWSQRARSCSSSSTGSPSAPTRAARPRRLDLHQRDQPVHLRLVRRRARRGCARAAARPRTAPGASSRRPPWPSSPR